MKKYRNISDDPYRDRFLDKHISKEEARQVLSEVLKLKPSQIEVVDFSEPEYPKIDWEATPVLCEIQRLEGDFPTFLEIEILAGDYDHRTYEFEEKLSEAFNSRILVSHSEQYPSFYEYLLIDGSSSHRLVCIDSDLIDHEEQIRIDEYLD